MKALFSVLFLNLLLFANKIDVQYLQGEQLYLQTCVSCHGIDGRADTNLKLIVKPRDLTKTILDEEQIYLITKDGARFWGAKSDIMPAFKYTFEDEQLRAVSYYISKKFNPNNKKRIKILSAIGSRISPI